MPKDGIEGCPTEGGDYERTKAGYCAVDGIAEERLVLEMCRYRYKTYAEAIMRKMSQNFASSKALLKC